MKAFIVFLLRVSDAKARKYMYKSDTISRQLNQTAHQQKSRILDIKTDGIWDQKRAKIVQTVTGDSSIDYFTRST